MWLLLVLYPLCASANEPACHAKKVYKQTSSTTSFANCGGTISNECHVEDGENFIDFRGLGDLESYSFVLHYIHEDLTTSSLTWTQMENPFSITDPQAPTISNVLLYSDGQEISLDKHYDIGPFAGLRISNRPEFSLLDGEWSSWFYSVGVVAFFAEGFPAVDPKWAKSSELFICLPEHLQEPACNAKQVYKQTSYSASFANCGGSITNECYVEDGENFIDFRGLGDLESYKFELHYTNADDSTSTLSWTQTENPFSITEQPATISNALLYIDGLVTSISELYPFLGLKISVEPYTLLDGNSPTWWYSVGVTSNDPSGFPGVFPNWAKASKMFICLPGTELTTGSCEEGSNWSEWISRDEPSGSEDNEEFVGHEEDSTMPCPTPTGLQAREVNGGGVMLTTQNVVFSLLTGFQCVNSDNNGLCNDYEIRVCCPAQVVDCDITEIDMCSVTCDGGVKQCTRTCINGVFGDHGCPSDQETKTEACNQQDCPQVVDCDFTALSMCSVTCGGGVKECTRTCLNGAFGDDGCPLDEESKMMSCDEQDCPQVVDCDITEIDTCSVTCNGGVKQCTRTCVNGVFGDDGCTLDQETKTATCNEQNCPQVVDCDITELDMCSITCGGGVKQCTRTCINGLFEQTGCPLDQETKTEICNEQDCPEVVDCDITEMNLCSVTCDGGLKQCARTCINGLFGDDGCSLDQETKMETCNEHDCPQVVDCDMTEMNMCSVTCDEGVKQCTRTCINGGFGDDGCAFDQETKTETCNEQDCPLKTCPNDECWMFDSETNSCLVIESAECFLSTCTSSAITGTLSGKALNLPSSENVHFMSGDRKIYFNGIEEPDCEIIPYTQFGSNMIFMNINVPLGSCDSFVTQEMVGNKSIITFGGAVRYESAPIHSFITFGDAAINIHFNCAFDASQHVSTNNTILDKDDIDGHGTDGSKPSWQDTFSLDLIDSATEDEVILAGNYVNVVVDWAIDSMHGKAKFMMEECTITQGNYSFPILKNKNCVLDLISMNIENENNDIFVDSSYKFSYRSFSFVGHAIEVQTFTLDCSIMVCIVDENGIPIAEECDLASNDDECASVDDIEGFTYLIDT